MDIRIRSRQRVSDVYRRSLYTLAFLLVVPAAASAQPASFQALEQAVIDFGNGSRPDIAVAACANDGANALTCLEGNSPIVGSGWDILRACYTLDRNGVLDVGFLQAGKAGDGDGDGNPNVGTFQFDAIGIEGRAGYSVDIETSVPPDGLSDFRFAVTHANVGGFNFGGLQPSEGSLCLLPPTIGDPVGVEPCMSVSGPVGAYTAGTTGGVPTTPEVLLEVETKLLPRPFDVGRFVMTLQSGSQDDTCVEDQRTFVVIPPSIKVDKEASGVCRPPFPGEFAFSADYTIVNDGALNFSSVKIEDSPTADKPLGTPSCSVTEGEPGGTPAGPLTIGALPGGGFTATLGALPSQDQRSNPSNPFPSPGDIDCGNDGKLDPSCGRVVIRCVWPGIPAGSFGQNESIFFNNQISVVGLDGTSVKATSNDSAGVRVEKNRCPRPPGDGGGGMRKEHEGVGFDNQLKLTPTLPLGSSLLFGSGVFPNGEPDVDSRETFTAQGALELVGRPGVWSNLPRIPPGHAGVLAQSGLPALFTWRMLVSNLPMQDVMDVSCSLCAEEAWRDDGSPAQTFTPRGLIMAESAPYLVANEPVMMELFHICGPIHTETPCGGPIDAITTPGLKRVPTDMRPYNYLEFLGCKAKTIQLEPFGGSGNSLILPGDLIEVRVLVPGSERSRVLADVTSCEAAYLTSDPKVQ